MCKAFKYDVFLGGSCSDTTWRKDVVIPCLKGLGITYFNPQKSIWTEDMIRSEERAKKQSKLLLFVISIEQPSLVSLIEIAFLTAQNSRLIVVLPSDEEQPNTWIDGHDGDRLKSLRFIRTILERHGIPEYRNIHVALEAIKKIVLRERSFSNLVREHGFYPRLLFANLWQKVYSLGQTLFQFLPLPFVTTGNPDEQNGLLATPSTSHNNFVCKYSSSSSAAGSNREKSVKYYFLGMTVLLEVLFVATLIFLPPGVSSNGYFSLKSFCIGVQLAIFCTVYFLHRRSRWHRKGPSSAAERGDKKASNYDVFLGGSDGQDNLWIKQRALPLLRKHGLSYLDSSVHQSEQRVALLHSCAFVFFVVSSVESLFSGIVELAYYAGTGSNVVGCIAVDVSNLDCKKLRVSKNKQKATVATRKVEYFQRGLLYLIDMAQSNGVKIIEDDFSLALQCLLDQVRNCRKV